MLARISASLVLWLWLSPATAEPAVYFENWQALQAAAEAGQHERVVQLASGLAEANPDDPTTWYLLGRSAFVLGQHDLAIEASQRAWDLGYAYMPWIALRIARSAAVLGHEDQVKAWLERALAHGLEDRQSIADYGEFQPYLGHSWFRALAAVDFPAARLEGLSADIDLIVSEARRLHPDYPNVAPGFEEGAEQLKQRLPNLNDRQVLFGLMRLVALLGDGHSVVYGPVEGSPLNVSGASLPVLFYLFEEGLFIVDGQDEGSPLIGRQVVRIGDRTPPELLEYSRRLHGADNPMTMVWLGVHFYFPSVDFLIEAGAADDSERITLLLATGGEELEAVELSAGNYEFPRKLRAPSAPDVEPPRYLERVGTNYWFEVVDEGQTVYFQFNQVRDSEGETLSAFPDRLGAALSDSNTTNLIIDLRHNNGGNNGLLTPLLRHLVAFDLRRGTRIFAIIGRNTFSAAQNFINRLDRLTDAVFVGEPSSSSPNFIGEETQLILPWSRVSVSISSRWWQDSSPGDERPWIAPQIPVPPRADDYFTGRDAALEAIMDVIRKSSTVDYFDNKK